MIIENMCYLSLIVTIIYYYKRSRGN